MATAVGSTDLPVSTELALDRTTSLRANVDGLDQNGNVAHYFRLYDLQILSIPITMFVVALSVSSAIFLILELDRPFDGVIQISSAPMRNLLGHLGH